MATADYFLKINGIEGESEDQKNKNELQLDGWSWSEHNSGSSPTGGGAGSGKVSMQDFQFSIKHGKASPKLMLACATGQHIPDAQLTCRKAGGEQEVFLKIKFTDVFISSYAMGGHGGGDVLDQITFNFTKIELETKPQLSTGKLGAAVNAGYDLKKNAKV
jgi:type VI secretion system secreted protein Hcp